MPELLDLSAAGAVPDSASHADGEQLRLLSRSPHPYHRYKSELLEPSQAFVAPKSRPAALRSRSSYPYDSNDASPSSASGTEADDEHFLKGLPAPKRHHKGIRGLNEVSSGGTSPAPSPAIIENDAHKFTFSTRRSSSSIHTLQAIAEDPRRRKEVARRLLEVVILGCLCLAVQINPDVRQVLRFWKRELYASLGIYITLVLLYPFRLVAWGYLHRQPSTVVPLTIPVSFDPAPALYPPIITLLVSSIVAIDNAAIIPPNIVLAIASLPAILVPSVTSDAGLNPVHWALSCVPLAIAAQNASIEPGLLCLADASSLRPCVTIETATLLYPLHHSLCLVLNALTTTSLLTAELQLLSVALIDLQLMSASPQMLIMKAMLWVGGLDLLLTCSHVVRWAVTLARVPKWRFRRALSPAKRKSSFLSAVVPWRRVRHDLFHNSMDSSSCSSCEAAHDEQEDSDVPLTTLSRVTTIQMDGSAVAAQKRFDSPDERVSDDGKAKKDQVSFAPQRRHTMPGRPLVPPKSQTHTPSGRRKRSASSSVQAFFSLTQEQADTRKRIYAAYMYVCIVLAIFAPFPYIGAMEVVKEEALNGHEAIGWALGYMFGEIDWLRWQVVSNNLQRWICLPPRSYRDEAVISTVGLVEQFRHHYLGEATTRLALSGYCAVVITIGLCIVFTLSPFYEVDTRRKVFHFMMVAMFLPSIYVDPAFIAMALSIILGLFLLLDLLRASQLPPLSKPLASFLAPYVDGRDLRGPVVISHIFLLIGCAIPLWLSLGSLPRTGTAYWTGWEVPTREISMVAGVVCVGLGDAAASLIGRRYGHRKWFWGGGKSLEGSLAFAVAVFIGLTAAYAWLRVGGWAITSYPVSLTSSPAQMAPIPAVPAVLAKTGICAVTASLTEAVLTGGNDNVIVPVVLWICVKSTGM
ncbi:dolichol kinase [Microdochium nivale]|nr:dolichol kinase [Microdochium nivale]